MNYSLIVNNEDDFGVKTNQNPLNIREANLITSPSHHSKIYSTKI